MQRARMLAGGIALGLCLTPSAHADDFVGVTPAGQLASFTVLDRNLRGHVTITGLTAGETVAAIDVRPSTGGLYGIVQLGSSLRLVRIDQATGAITRLGVVNIAGTVNGVGFDINPSDETANVVTDNDRALRFDLTTGVATVLPDPTTAASTAFTSVAWASSDGGASLPFAVDSAGDRLYVTNGSGGPVESPELLGVNASTRTSLDFSAANTLWLHLGTPADDLYRVDTYSGVTSIAGGTGPLTAVAVRLSGGFAYAAPSFGASEGDAAATVVLRRDAPADGTARVTWSTADDSATAGADYTPASGTVTFGRGETVKEVSVPLLPDTAAEGAERIRLTLSSVDGVPAGGNAAIVVADDDQPATTPPPPPLPPADTLAPVVLALPVTIAPARTLRVPFALSEAGSATVALRIPRAVARRAKLPATLATTTLAATAGVNRATLRLPAATVRKLRSRRVTATAAIAATDAAGNAGSARVAVRLRRAR